MSQATIGQMFHSAGAVETFLGFPRCDDLERLDAAVAILGAPVATPYRSVGAYCAGAPGAIRAAMAGYAASRGHMDFDLLAAPFAAASVADCGDLPWDAEDFAANRERITDAVRKVLKAGAVPVVLGGDDSIPIPLFRAFEGGGPYTVVQIDAHIDWRDEVDGEHHGLSSPMRRASEMPWIERIVQVGARAIGSARPGDYEVARAWGVEFVTGRELARQGVQTVLELVPPGAKVLLTLDCDGMDPTVMPAVIGPAPGGLSYWQVVELIHGLAERATIAGFDIVEFMPAADRDGLAALTAARVVCNVLGALVKG
ncbi:agmatinase [Tistlia consotensis]|uniref:Agmatinase n=1 Tax=Tistlia consotensis USBA 355 TaxID=560819 RepID=A0A1Y6CE27_9PROT|nr:agmatinase [Tistlia consotensis]SMF56577.1 agmatinase [Tistlia consotensis USBA 355]SNR44762.1 agmatinase [Tistlia consotensis]